MDRPFLRLQPPAGYVPGIGRGAVGFNKQTKPEFPKLPQPSADIRPTSSASAVSVQDIYEEAERKKYQRKRRSVQLDKPANDANSTNSTNSTNSSKRVDTKTAGSASFQEWANMPPAVDTLRTYHRINSDMQNQQRTYAAPVSADETKTMQIEKLESELRSDSKNASVYIQLAALLPPIKAKQILTSGIYSCPPNDQMYLDLAKLLPAAERRSMLARGLKLMKTSEKLWVQAVQCEPTTEMQLQCVHMGLLQCPKSEQLWRFAVELEPRLQSDVLSMAQQFVPQFAMPQNAQNVQNAQNAQNGPTSETATPNTTTPNPESTEMEADNVELSEHTLTLLEAAKPDPMRSVNQVKTVPEHEQLPFIRKLIEFLVSPLRKRALYSQALSLVPRTELYDDWIELERSLKNPFGHLEARRNALSRVD